MDNYNQAQITEWVNTAQGSELTVVGKHLLTRISALPQNERDNFARDVGNIPSIAKLFKQTA